MFPSNAFHISIHKSPSWLATVYITSECYPFWLTFMCTVDCNGFSHLHGLVLKVCCKILRQIHKDTFHYMQVLKPFLLLKVWTLLFGSDPSLPVKIKGILKLLESASAVCTLSGLHGLLSMLSTSFSRRLVTVKMLYTVPCAFLPHCRIGCCISSASSWNKQVTVLKYIFAMAHLK